MGNSTKFCKEYLANKNIDFSSAKEYNSAEFFDQIMHGERTRIANTKLGSVKIEIRFDKNAEFNSVDSFSGTRNGFKNDVEENIAHCVKDLLTTKVYVPYSDGVPVGGIPRDGDKIVVTFGNIVYTNNVTINNNVVTQEVHICIPKLYERVPGGLYG